MNLKDYFILVSTQSISHAFGNLPIYIRQYLISNILVTPTTYFRLPHNTIQVIPFRPIYGKPKQQKRFEVSKRCETIRRQAKCVCTSLRRVHSRCPNSTDVPWYNLPYLARLQIYLYIHYVSYPIMPIQCTLFFGQSQLVLGEESIPINSSM